MLRRRFKTEILVRNNRVDLMKKQGIFVNYSVLSDEDYLIELKRKVV